MKRDPSYYAYLSYFILYFFFNNLLLKEGLLYTTLMAPLFVYWLFKQNRLKDMLTWALLLIIPIPFHLILGVDASTYVISSLLVAAAWIFLFTALETVRNTLPGMDDLFKKILIVNAILVMVALLLLPFPFIRDIMWDSVPMSKNLEAIPRLKLLAYEPSHYGLLLSPVIFYFLLQIFTGKASHPLLTALAVGLPLLLTFSFGIIGAMFLATGISSIAYFHRFSHNSRRLYLYGLGFLLVTVIGLWVFWPGNPLFTRLGNILEGSDSSSKGRLFYSFMFAKDLVAEHAAWLGVGPGQIKVLAHDLIINFYQYTGHYSEVVRIPNSMGEMLATYGIYGFVLKIVLELWFFVRMKVYKNLYCLTLFAFIFIYQFTGSFLVNAAEIGIWAFVFMGRFEKFELENLKEGTS